MKPSAMVLLFSLLLQTGCHATRRYSGDVLDDPQPIRLIETGRKLEVTRADGVVVRLERATVDPPRLRGTVEPGGFAWSIPLDSVAEIRVEDRRDGALTIVTIAGLVGLAWAVLLASTYPH